MLITSVNNDRIKELVKLKIKKYRDKTNRFIVEGLDVIDIAYKNNCLLELYIIYGYENPYEDINCTYVSEDVMKKISDMDSCSYYLGVCKKMEEGDITDKIILLDDIQDPGNLGTIIRSCVAFNFKTIVLSRNTVDVYNSKVIRSTKGMIFNINIIHRDSLEFLSSLDGYTIYGTSVIEGINIRDKVLSDKMVLVIGNEGQGIKKEIRDVCDEFIYIKMNNLCESLNAGVAASILMYEVMNR